MMYSLTFDFRTQFDYFIIKSSSLSLQSSYLPTNFFFKVGWFKEFIRENSITSKRTT